MITDTQREQRRQHVGSSDSPAILGVSPYATAGDVYWSKLGVEKPWRKEYDAGNYFEAAVLDHADKMIGIPIAVRDETFISKGGILAANVDGMTTDGEPVEVKTVRFNSPVFDEWGDEGTDEIPRYVMVQAQHQLHCCDADTAYVVGLFSNFDTRTYVVKRHPTMIDMIVSRGEAFWRDHVEKRVPPPETASVEVLKRIPREPGKVASVPIELVRAACAARDDVKAASQKLEAAKAALIEAMGDGEIAESDGFRVSLALQSRKEYTVKPSEFRALNFRLKGNK